MTTQEQFIEATSNLMKEHVTSWVDDLPDDVTDEELTYIFLAAVRGVENFDHYILHTLGCTDSTMKRIVEILTEVLDAGKATA